MGTEMKWGADGYSRVQKQSVYGTAVTGAMSTVPIRGGAIRSIIVQMIENANIIAQRYRQLPNKGRKVNNFSLPMSIYPDDIGMWMNFFLGAATSAAVGDGAYNHYWLQELSAERDGSIFTYDFAQGAELEEQLIGCMINKIIINSDNEGNVTFTVEGVAKDYATDKARITSFAYSSKIPYAFKHVSITENGLGDISASIESINLEIDLAHDVEKFRLGDDTIKRMVFNGIPIITMDLTVDAEQQWIDAARAYTDYDFTVAFTSTENAGTTPTVFSFAIEMPRCRLNPELAHPEESMERLKHDLSFIADYGGTTTNSGTDNVAFEIRVTDDTATYTA
ncbi:MAG: phage tail tube protein [Candidatus Thorarchaeota archaeon]